VAALALRLRSRRLATYVAMTDLLTYLKGSCGPGIPPYRGLAPLGPDGEARDAAVRELVVPAAEEMTAAVNAGRRVVGLAPLAEPDKVLLRPPATLDGLRGRDDLLVVAPCRPVSGVSSSPLRAGGWEHALW
jgi:hypothetical protein